jgi:GH15 family glucan-1,4-alpha-glucosidase
MLTDGKTITPGPFTYHQFWFRDAAYMLLALDKFGYADFTTAIIKSFPGHQLPSGYFRSQKGEWDSNGQALWISLNHSILTADKKLLAEIFDSLFR